jgi:hypothetical protein
MLTTISFESVAPQSTPVRVTDDGLMFALDLFTVLTGRDRKKASQTLARIGSKSETASLLTLRTSAHKKNPRKLVSFGNAIHLLLTLPRRTASLPTRRAIAQVLVNYFEKDVNGPTPRETQPAVKPTTDDVASMERKLAMERAAIDLERQRAQLPLEQIRKCIELASQCAPLTDDEVLHFKRAIAAHT